MRSLGAVVFLALLTAPFATAQTSGCPYQTAWSRVAAHADLAEMDRIIALMQTHGSLCSDLVVEAQAVRTRAQARIAERARRDAEQQQYLRDQQERQRQAEAERARIAALWPRGREFDDCGGEGWCPRMIVLPDGSFRQTSSDQRYGPWTVFQRSFAVGKYEVTVGEWSAFVRATNRTDDPGASDCTWRDAGLEQNDRHPVVCVTPNAALDYVQWLSGVTHRQYRLLTSDEWEYAARGGNDSAYSWGTVASHDQANYGSDVCCGPFVGGRDQWVFTSPTGSFPANGYGLYDFNGNVFEYVDCAGALPRCPVRGGSWYHGAEELRSDRSYMARTEPERTIGFRVARTLTDQGPAQAEPVARRSERARPTVPSPTWIVGRWRKTAGSCREFLEFRADGDTFRRRTGAVSYPAEIDLLSPLFGDSESIATFNSTDGAWRDRAGITFSRDGDQLRWSRGATTCVFSRTASPDHFDLPEW
jgi:formylglycine-generating enzyme required for sulfatase activity